VCEKGQEAHKETDGSTTVRFWLSNCAVWLKNSDVLHPLRGDDETTGQGAPRRPHVEGEK